MTVTVIYLYKFAVGCVGPVAISVEAEHLTELLFVSLYVEPMVIL